MISFRGRTVTRSTTTIQPGVNVENKNTAGTARERYREEQCRGRTRVTVWAPVHLCVCRHSVDAQMRVPLCERSRLCAYTVWCGVYACVFGRAGAHIIGLRLGFPFSNPPPTLLSASRQPPKVGPQRWRRSLAPLRGRDLPPPQPPGSPRPRQTPLDAPQCCRQLLRAATATAAPHFPVGEAKCLASK